MFNVHIPVDGLGTGVHQRGFFRRQERQYLAGDAVLVETPGYYPLFGKLHLAKANIIGIPRGPDDPDLEAIERQARVHHPRLMYVQPIAHNPTGTSMSLPAMHRLLQIAERHNIILIEDDPFADIMPRTTPHLASLDGLDRVIYLGTFSKTLSASLRCGYVAANKRLITSLTDIKMLTVVTTSGTTERMIHDFIVKGRYRRHLVRLMDRVAHASNEACICLESIGIRNLLPPTGGYYIWCPLPEHISDIELAKKASKEGIFLAPGSLFSKSDEEQPPALRMNIAHASDSRLLSFLRTNL
jgi:DNA-binding transcriptional MocR family regulator